MSNNKSGAYNRSLALSPCQLCSRDECLFPSTCQGDPWKCLQLLVKKADCSMYKHRRENLDHYLRYAVIMFTFNCPVLADSYKWLTGHASYSVIAQLCADHHPSHDGTLFIPYKAAVAVVALWAMSFLLTSVLLLMCHLSRQWLQEFMNQPQFSYKNQLAFRQIHYDSLRRWAFFNICDTIPLLLPLSGTFFIAGLIVFLWQLNHPDACVCLGIFCVLFLYYVTIALHPFYCFWKAPHDGLTSELSPFRSPSSWLFFKLSMNWFNFTSYCTHRRKASLKYRRALLPLHSHESQPRLPVRTKSIDWLEQDCSLFMQGDDAPDIDIPLTNALIWIDSNPTIEKTTKVVVSIYHAVTHLHLPNILPFFKETCTGSERGLAEIITTASQKFTDVNDPVVTAFVLKSWLELHVTRLPELRIQLTELEIHCMNEIGKKMLDYARIGIKPINAFLLPGTETLFSFLQSKTETPLSGRLPVKKVHSLLAGAKTCLAKSKYYYEGTFKLILQVVFQFQDSASERQVSSVLAVLTECKQFAYSFRRSGVDEQQALQFISELGEFLSDVQPIDCDFDPTSGQRSWSPRSSDIWKETITIANEVFYIANFGFRDTFSASPTGLVDDRTCSVSTKASFDSMQFGSNNTRVESATNALTVWSADAASKCSDPKALIRIQHADADFVLQRTWTRHHP